MKHTSIFLTLAFLFAIQFNAQAQRDAGDIGIGAQFGQPSALSLKVYQPDGISTDIQAAWDLDNFYFVNVHGMIENHIGSAESFHYFVGPGVFAGLRDGGTEGETEFAAGISGNFGLNLIIRRVELYGQLTPRLELIDETEGMLGGGIGIRFYL